MGFVRRRQEEGAHDAASDESGPPQPATADEDDQLPVTDAALLSAFLPRTLRERGQPTASEDEHHPLAERGEAVEAPGDYREVGAHVASVLASADHAAEQIRQDARQEAIRIEDDARLEAARIRHEAAEALQESNQQRSDTEQYIAEVRAAAVRYAEEKQQQADAEASTARVTAETDARSIVRAAVRRARAIEKTARRRAAEIDKESRRAEERLKEFLAIVRTVTGRLEDTLGAEVDEAAFTEDTDAPPDQAPKKRSARRAAS